MVLLPFDSEGLAPIAECFQGHFRKEFIEFFAGFLPDRLGDTTSIKEAFTLFIFLLAACTPQGGYPLPLLPEFP